MKRFLFSSFILIAFTGFSQTLETNETSQTVRPLFPVLRVPQRAVQPTPEKKQQIAVDEYLFTVQEGNRDIGSAFVQKDKDGIWLVSNYHVVAGKNDLKFISIKDKNRSYSLPGEIQLAATRDAIRFAVDFTNGLSLAETFNFDDEVYAFGNSGGAGVVTKNKGTIVGKGADEIEVTCDIIPGNSGGPVIDKNQNVIGMATYILKSPAMKISEALKGKLSSDQRARLIDKQNETKGTRYTETRRFAIRLSDIEWQPLTRKEFEKQSAALQEALDEYDDFCDAIFAICKAENLPSHAKDVISPTWIRTYERTRDNLCAYNRLNQTYYILHNKEKSFTAAYIRWIKDLSKFSAAKSKSFKQIEESLTAKYFIQRIDDKVTSLSDMAEGLQTAAKDIKD